MTKTSELPEVTQHTVSLPEARNKLAECVAKRFLCVLTGLPGVGKSYITEKLMSNKDSWLIIDDYIAVDKNGKYNSQPPPEALDKAWVVSGTSDNASEIVDSILSRRQKSLNGIALFYVVPDHKVFSESNALKARKSDEHARAINYWGAQSKLSEVAFKRSVSRNYDAWKAHLVAVADSHEKPFESTLIRNQFDGKAITKGWHGAPVSPEHQPEADEKGGSNE